LNQLIVVNEVNQLVVNEWESDEKVSKCRNCGVEFSIIKRRHHCRACGKIFCGDCSNKQGLCGKESKLLEPVRMCDNCYENNQDVELMELFPGELWCEQGTIYEWGMRFFTRMTVIRLKDNKLWIHSPLPLIAKRKLILDKLGEVKYIVAPNKMHHLFVKEYFSAYPLASIYGVAGLKEKRPDLQFHGILASNFPEPAWKGSLEQLIVQGNDRINEVVFFHVNTKSLILTDMIENFQTSTSGISPLKLGAVLTAGIFEGAINRAKASSEFIWMSNRVELRESLQIISKWDFDNILLCHGDVIFG